MALSNRNRLALWNSRRFWAPGVARLKQAGAALRSAAGRPSQSEAPAIGSYNPDTPTLQWPQYSSWYHQWYLLADYSLVCKIALQALGVRIVRKGFEWKPKYAAVCLSCGAELAELPPPVLDEDTKQIIDPATGGVAEGEASGDILRECPECGSFDLREPDLGATRAVDTFLRRANLNGRSWRHIVRQTKRDLDIADELFIIRRKAYFLDDDGRIRIDKNGLPRFELVEWVPGDPRLMRIVATDRGVLGGLWGVCIRCRSEGRKQHGYAYNRPAPGAPKAPSGRQIAQDGRCPQCKGILYDAHYVAMQGKSTRAVGYGTVGVYDTFYIAGEVLHTSQYTPTTLYSSAPPLAAAWLPLSLIESVLGYLHDFYSKRRNPRMFVWVKGVGHKWVDEVGQKHKQTADKDPDEIPILNIPTNSEIGDITLDQTPREMLMDKVIDQWANRAAMAWQVRPQYGGENKGTGLSQDGISVTITEDAVDDGQQVYNKDVHPILVEEDLSRIHPGIVDFELLLVPNREEDDAKVQELRNQRAAEAQVMRAMGFKVEIVEQEGKLVFRYSGEASAAPDLSLDGFDDLLPDLSQDRLAGARDPGVTTDNPMEDTGPEDKTA